MQSTPADNTRKARVRQYIEKERPYKEPSHLDSHYLQIILNSDMSHPNLDDRGALHTR